MHTSTYIATYFILIITYLTEPSALKVTTAKNIINSLIIVQWNKVDDSLPTNYTVTWTSDVTIPVQSITLLEQSHTITGLILDTVYTITVTANNICGTGPEYSTSVSFLTGMCHYHYLLCSYCICT